MRVNFRRSRGARLPAAAHRRQHKDAGVFVPEGPDDGSRHGMPGTCPPEARPVLSAIARMATEEGYGMIGW